MAKLVKAASDLVFEIHFRISVWGSLPNDALLRVKPYDFYWQLYYRLAEPMPLKMGTRLNWIATYDNSAANPRNPNPAADGRYGQQSWE